MFPIQMVRDVLNYPIEFTFFDNMNNFKMVMSRTQMQWS
ncbi:hypothetical protein RDI58_010102 [Solanum bulbocastanum]|uniref:Uncharacterized protein n=1 Tax=Solanum bulbocastanum TaxID=147425 RepID=A0AAN8YGF1_SOLBU